MSPVLPMPVTWTPGPTGVAEPPTLGELAALLWDMEGRPGLCLEDGRNSDIFQTVHAVYRGEQGMPVAIATLKLYEGQPALVDVVVDERCRRRGYAWACLTFLKVYGFDVRTMGAIYDGPLTDEGRKLRDAAVARANVEFGEIR